MCFAYFLLNVTPPLAIFAGKKYKPVALKVRPVETELPSCFCIICNIRGDPLENYQNYTPAGLPTDGSLHTGAKGTVRPSTRGQLSAT
jgi:hypothetical protein